MKKILTLTILATLALVFVAGDALAGCGAGKRGRARIFQRGAKSGKSSGSYSAGYSSSGGCASCGS